VSAERARGLRIAVVTPGLGLGGAARLMVDAAVGLQRTGHDVQLFTAAYDPERCFDEVRNGTLRLTVLPSRFPGHLRGRLRAPCMITRTAILAARVARRYGPFDVILCDLVAQIVPVLRRFTDARIVFYCHYPDRLLTPPRGGVYSLYRAPLDWWEGWATGMAHRILVNSQFTIGVFRRTFPGLAARPLEVVYPAVEIGRFAAVPPLQPSDGGPLVLLSINRFHPQKRLELAVEAMAALRDRLTTAVFQRVRLVMAGGYDARDPDNVAVLDQLRVRARELSVESRVSFRTAVSDGELIRLLGESTCVVYTPEREHFGIVPLEAMAAGRPVIAVNNGGPCESVRDGDTGFLRPPSAAAFADAIALVLSAPEQAKCMGSAAREHVRLRFSRTAFAARFDKIVRDLGGGCGDPVEGAT
jgi:alpha-1,3/alpha-1,6-mannosyltransferase